MRVYSFYYLKWRHLVNRLPTDNATLKLNITRVGRHLEHRQDERCVCGTGDQGTQQSILVMRRFLATGYCIRLRYAWSLQVDAAARQRSPSHTARSNV